MIRLILAALRHRRAQALTVLVLTTFAVAAAVASPWYVAGAADKAAAADLASAGQRERLVAVTRNVTVRDAGGATDPVDQARSAVPAQLDIPGATAVVGAVQNGNVAFAAGTTNMPIAYRDGMCEHLKITGRCPQQASEALLSAATAERLGFHVGDPVKIAPAFGDGQQLTLVGTYDFTDPTGAYWAGTRFIGEVGQGSAGSDPMFVAIGTFGGAALQQVTVTVDIRVPDEAFRGSLGAGLGDVVANTTFNLNQQGYATEFIGQPLAERVALDQDTIRIGVPVGAAQLLALSWFAFFLAGRYAARERRSDIALLKLRGTTTFRQLRLTAGQSAIPMLGGLLLGGALGVVTARLLAGAVRPESQLPTLRISVAAAVLAMVGGLLAVVFAEWRMLRSPVAELLRGVPPRRRGWRTDLVDLLVVAVAVSAAYQAKTQGTGRIAGLAPLARGLVALAVALLLARLIGLVIGAVGGSALRAGRLRFALGALQVTRRPGMDRVFALLMVAVAALCTSVVDWSGASAARTERATLEVGASRVLTVSSDNRWHFMAAVRTADPTGTQAMAVVYRGSAGTNPAVLAVDSSRLAAVASWQSGYGASSPAQLAQLLRPPAPEPLLVRGAALTVRASADAPGTWLVARVQHLDTGLPEQVGFGPLAETATDFSGALGCATAAGCRLLSLGVAGGPDKAPGAFLPTPGAVTVTVSQLTQHAPDAAIADATVLGDVQRWRTTFGHPTLVVGTTGGGLQLVDADPGTPVDQRAYTLDAAVPLPAVVAGGTARLWPFGDPTLAPLGGDTVPIQIVGAAPALPILGGIGVIVDLAAASRLDTTSVGLERQQVWLAPGAPADIVDRLKAAGITVTSTDSISTATGRLASQGPTAALRFALFAALLGLLLAATSVAVAAAGETRPRAAELAALRAQGVPARSARAVSYGGYLGLVLAGVLGGVLATVITRVFVPTGLPTFVDSWTTLPVSTGLRLYPLLLVTLGALLLLGVTAAVAASRLIRATDAGAAGPAGTAASTRRPAAPRARADAAPGTSGGPPPGEQPAPGAAQQVGTDQDGDAR